ncbi:arginase family protein [Brevibacillus sp. SIMBA_040]|uniref:arginase family protein n=1 Tax=unclassified Brevibacillus TaxID=2684853 RepID=UPI00397CCA7C
MSNCSVSQPRQSKIIGFDVVEVSPSLDNSSVAVFAARKILTECWGHYLRKNKPEGGK